MRSCVSRRLPVCVSFTTAQPPRLRRANARSSSPRGTGIAGHLSSSPGSPQRRIPTLGVRDGFWPRTAGRGRCLESPSKMATLNASARTPPIVLLPDPDAPIATTGGAFGIEELPTLIAMSGHSAQEGFSSILSGVVEDLCGAAGLHDETLVHEDDPVRDLARETHFVKNDDHRHSLV